MRNGTSGCARAAREMQTYIFHRRCVRARSFLRVFIWYMMRARATNARLFCGQDAILLSFLILSLSLPLTPPRYPSITPAPLSLSLDLTSLSSLPRVLSFKYFTFNNTKVGHALYLCYDYDNVPISYFAFYVSLRSL